MVEWGLTPLKAMQAATANAAELLRLEDIGTIAAGKTADLVLYASEVFEEIDAVLKPTMVMKAGDIVAGQAM